MYIYGLTFKIDFFFELQMKMMDLFFGQVLRITHTCGQLYKYAVVIVTYF